MGLLPYTSPAERDRSRQHHKHYDNFLEVRGFKKCKLEKTLWQLIFGKKYKAYTGVVYDSIEEFRKKHGWFPDLIRDGIHYGFYEPKTLFHYIDPFVDEIGFLTLRGYKRFSLIQGDYHDDYFLSVETEKNYCEKHGFVPRWEKDGQYYDTEQALAREGYVYNSDTYSYEVQKVV